ncbi:MAG: helix-turn-helix transcriptional regulator [Culicoidibacterales bacterium]
MTNIIEIQAGHISPLEQQMPLYYTMELIQETANRVVHEGARIWYVARGEAKFYLNEQYFEMKKGMCIAIFPWDVTIIDQVIEEVELHIIVYRFSAINAHIRLLETHFNKKEPMFLQLKQNPVVYIEGKLENEMFQLVEQIGRLQGSDLLYNVMEQESVFVQMICRIAKAKTVGIVEDSSRGVASDTTLVLAIDVMQYMSSHFNEKLTLDYVAQQFFTNKTTIAKVIREVFSMTFVQLLSRMRLHKSVEMLVTTNDTLDDIAQMVGYFDSAHFTKQFECAYNVTPIAYRKQYTGVESLPLSEIEKVLEYIRNHFSDETIRAHQVAKQFSISATTLNTWIMFYTECTFDDWIHLLRMHHAVRLLRTTNHTILDIAITVGYTNTRTFQRIFEQHFYTTPAQYRKI